MLAEIRVTASITFLLVPVIPLGKDCQDCHDDTKRYEILAEKG
jgi:hypothetical protein